MRNIFWMMSICLAFASNTIAQTSNARQYKYVFTVAKDGTGDYMFIQDAIDAMRVYPLAPIILYIKNGLYHEKIELPSNNTDVTFIGENADSTIISFNDYSGKGRHNTFTSYTAKISGNRFRAENICFTNSAGAVGQALALYVDADKAVFLNCKFLGNQDTIFTSGENSNQLFTDCYIEGTTDFIFGPSTAVFQHCTIRAKSNSYITAASTTIGKKFGYVFIDCNIIADSSVTKLFLGRPWRANAKTVFIRCNLPQAIVPQGWDNWGNIENEKTVFYAEYKNKGAGTNPSKRVSWAKQLNSNLANSYQLSSIFNQSNSTTKENNLWYSDSKHKPFAYDSFMNKKIETLPLYSIVPNSIAAPNKESSLTSTKDNVTRISKVSVPSITIYKPSKPNGMSVIICPGGAYAILSWIKEGTRIAEELNRVGITAIVLKYRLPDDTTMIDKSIAPLQDAQAAIRYVRKNATLLGVATNKIGIMGFSAGGHLASTAATHFNFKADANNTDSTSVSPSFNILIYPVISFDSAITHKGSRDNLLGKNAKEEQIKYFSNELQVTPQTAPVFIVHAADDKTVPVANSIRFYEACIKNKVSVEMHLYPNGGHGFGLNNSTTTDNWMERLKNWLGTIKL